MTMMKWIVSGTLCAGLAACGDGADLGDSAFQSSLTAFESQSQIAALVNGTSDGTSASFATLTTQGAATYTGPVAINLGDTPLLGENILGEPVLNDPDLLGSANIRTAFTDTGATLDGDFTNFVGSDGSEYGGALALTNGVIGGSPVSDGTEASAVVSGTLTGDGAGAGSYSANVRGDISTDAQNILLRGRNADGQAGRDFVLTAAGTIPVTQ